MRIGGELSTLKARTKGFTPEIETRNSFSSGDTLRSRPRQDLPAIFFLILVIVGGAYLFVNRSGFAVDPENVGESTRNITGRLTDAGERIETISRLLNEAIPVSLITGYPEESLNKARHSFSEAKSLIPDLQYHALKLRSTSDRIKGFESELRTLNVRQRNLLAKHIDALQKEFGAEQRMYDEAVSGISSGITTAETNLKWAVFAFVEGLLLMTMLAGAATCILAVNLPRLRRSKDSILELEIRDADVPNTVLLPRRDASGLDVYGLLKERGLLSGTARALLGMLAAHPEFPASIEGHAPAELGLIQHIENTVRLVLNDLPQDMDPNAAAVTALAHDIGKILAYQKVKGGRWVKTGLYHDRLSAAILLSLPEFHKNFRGDVKTAILAAVRYHHALLDISINSPPLARKLFDLLQKHDSAAATKEKQEAAESIAPYVYSSFGRILPELNINGIKAERAHGYVVENSKKIVLVYEYALREAIIANLPAKSRAGITMERPANSIHPVWPVIASVLTEKGALLRQVDNIEADKNGFFAAEIEARPGKKDIHRCLVALDGEMAPPDIWEAWTSTVNTIHPKILGQNEQESPHA